MSRPLHVCVIGSGWIGKVHAQVYRELAGEFPTHLSFCDVDLARAEKARVEFDGAAAFASIEEACAAADVDLIDICLPHDLHVAAMETAAPSGKHVLLEKPMGRDVAECDRVISLVAPMKAKFMVAECWRFYSHVVRAIEAIRAGEIGRVFLIETCSVGRFAPPAWRRSLRAAGGGALMDRGVHFVDMLLALGGPVATVFSAQTRMAIQEIEGDDTSVMSVRYESGAIGQQLISWGFQRGIDRPYFCVHGTEGSLIDGDQLKLVRRDAEPRILAPSVGAGWPDYHMIRDTIRHFLDCVTNEKTPLFTPTMARADVELVTAAYASGREARSIDLPYNGPGAAA
ncbi:MAG: Gfo/Idh/MocA family oxidoreductase [Candidatus Sumerlaeota bacterium]|nr:Gfo/Idh/MocA family oxidoreductase [Candidatus Sumerlaeota bacterium]